MDFIKRMFPISMKANDVKGLVVAIIIYIVANFVGGFVLSLLAKLPLIGFVAAFVGWVLGAYCAIGVIVAFLCFFGIIR